MTTTAVLFHRLGGKPAVNAAVDVFYERVLADPTLADFFRATDMDRQRAKLKGFLTMAFGGPAQYTGRSLREGHAHLVDRGLSDVHFDAVLGHLGAALKSLGVGLEPIRQVAAIAESVRDDVLGR